MGTPTVIDKLPNLIKCQCFGYVIYLVVIVCSPSEPTSPGSLGPSGVRSFENVRNL